MIEDIKKIYSDEENSWSWKYADLHLIDHIGLEWLRYQTAMIGRMPSLDDMAAGLGLPRNRCATIIKNIIKRGYAKKASGASRKIITILSFTKKCGDPLIIDIGERVWLGPVPTGMSIKETKRLGQRLFWKASDMIRAKKAARAAALAAAHSKAAASTSPAA